MKKYLLLFLAIGTLYANPSEGVTGSKNVTVLTVNGVSITKKDLDRETDILLPRAYFHGNITPKKRKKVEEEAIGNLIDKELLFQEATSKGFIISDGEITETKEKVVTGFGGEENFKAILKRANLTQEEFFRELKREMVIKKLLDKVVKVSFSDEEIKRYYENNRGKFKEPERLRVRLIVVKIDPTDANGTIKANSKIDEAYKKIENGEAFADIAAKYSHDRSRIKGGDLGYLHKGMLDSRIEKKIYDLKIGEVSKIIKTEIGFSIVKLEEKKPSRQLSYETVKERLKTERVQNVQKKRMDALLKRLKSSAKIENLIE